jgi:hypothetical protein
MGNRALKMVVATYKASSVSMAGGEIIGRLDAGVAGA